MICNWLHNELLVEGIRNEAGTGEVHRYLGTLARLGLNTKVMNGD